MPRNWKRILAAMIALAVMVAGVVLYVRLTAPRVFVVVLTAFEAEAAPVIAALTDAERGETARGVVYTHGWRDGTEIAVLETGSGMVNAAAMAQHALDSFPVSHLIFSGIAGGLDPSLAAGMVAVPEFWINHEYETVTPQGRAPLTLDLPPQAASRLGAMNAVPVDGDLLASAREIENVRTGGVGVSGDVFVASDGIAAGLRERFGAAVVDMESAAVAQVALVNGVPFIAVRGISDGAGEVALSQIQTNVAAASEAAARVTVALIDGLR